MPIDRITKIGPRLSEPIPIGQSELQSFGIYSYSAQENSPEIGIAFVMKIDRGTVNGHQVIEDAASMIDDPEIIDSMIGELQRLREKVWGKP